MGKRREVRTSCWEGWRECSALGVSCTLWLGLSLSGAPMNGGSTQSHALHLFLGLVLGGVTYNLFSGVSELHGGERGWDGSGEASFSIYTEFVIKVVDDVF